MTLPEFITGGDLVLLVAIGLGAGVLSGFAGVGGGFLVTPALIIIGFPASYAVGTSLAWVAGNSVVGTWRHFRLGNIDIRIGALTAIFTMLGMECGVRLLNLLKTQGLADDVVLSIGAVMLLSIGSYTLWESHHRKLEIDAALKHNHRFLEADDHSALSRKIQTIRLLPIIRSKTSRVNISLWILGGIGLSIGVLAGLMGVGGGFIMVPVLVYLVGMQSFIAVGTDIFQILFSATYGAVRHGLSGNVILTAAVIMLVFSSIGVQFGAMVTRYVRGLSVRYVLGVIIILSAVSVAIKLAGTLLGGSPPLDILAIIITFGSLLFAVGIIIVLFVISLRYRRGAQVPQWIVSFLAGEPQDIGRDLPKR